VALGDDEQGSIIAEDRAEAFSRVTQQAPFAEYAAELLGPEVACDLASQALKASAIAACQ
jgi:hypothetical protein